MADWQGRRLAVEPGIEIFYRDYPGPETGGGLPVLCLHGLTRNSADFEPIAPHLARRRRVLAMDVRGRGQSDRDPDWRRYHPGTYVADAFKLLAHEGLDRVVLLGTSMGGIMSMMMGAARPELIAGIILNDIGPKVEEAGVRRISGYVGAREEPFADLAEAVAAIRAINEPFYPDLDDAAWERYARRLLVRDADGRWRFAYDPAIRRNFTEARETAAPDLWAVFDGLAPIPLLVLRGETSDILAAETLEEMARRHPDCTAVTVPNRGHPPLLDEPEAVAAIDAFLARLDAAARAN
ncbi:MAG: alpha/beta hydrolase [Rhodothalassiaceae bacterium]|nr:MAG: alpha/beta hydrolase [Rhodothalassiaceae bacterium]